MQRYELSLVEDRRIFGDLRAQTAHENLRGRAEKAIVWHGQTNIFAWERRCGGCRPHKKQKDKRAAVSATKGHQDHDDDDELEIILVHILMSNHSDSRRTMTYP